jgi:hypothetical protein
MPKPMTSGAKSDGRFGKQDFVLSDLGLSAHAPIARLLRTRIAPVAIPTLAKFEAVRDFLFRTVSQITISYRHCSFNAGEAGEIHGGDRLPW